MHAGELVSLRFSGCLGGLQNVLEVVGTKGEVDIIVVHAPFVRKFLGRCLARFIWRLGPQPS